MAEVEKKVNIKLDGIDLKQEIIRLVQLGLSKTSIANELGISRKTVYVHMNKSYADYQKEYKTKPLKDFANLEFLIKNLIVNAPSLSNAQVYDRLLEYYQEVYDDNSYELNVSKSTIKNYVNMVRNKYEISKPVIQTKVRDYAIQSHEDIGEWTQVDFGQYNMRAFNKIVEVHFIVFVLCYSRMAYVDFLDRPFTAKDTVISHLKAFDYFGGISNRLLYDQDKKILVKENFGDFIYTDEFEKLVTEYKITPVFCNAGDPESKGLVEINVQYVKKNFLNERKFIATDVLNYQALNWCIRISKRIHDTTKKKPIKMFLEEKEHLRPITVPTEYSYSIITRSVSEYNSISYKGNKYSLPQGSYGGGIRYVRLEIYTTSLGMERMRLFATDTTFLVADHMVKQGAGFIVNDPSHRGDVDREDKEKNLVEDFTTLFTNKNIALVYCDGLINKYKPRRWEIRQLREVISIAKCYEIDMRNKILEYCVTHQLFGVNFFNEVAQYKISNNTNNILPITNSTKETNTKISKASLSDYQRIFDNRGDKECF